jgi:hypothetical protein
MEGRLPGTVHRQGGRSPNSRTPGGRQRETARLKVYRPDGTSSILR